MSKPGKILELISMVNASEIASIGKVLQIVIGLINDPASTARQLTAALEMDPPLTAKILKISNSAFYGARGRINSIKKAAVWLGYDSIREAALNQKAADFFQNGKIVGSYSRDILWKQSLIAALLNKAIHRKIFRIRDDNAYISGILHQLGILVFEQFLYSEFTKIVRTSQNEKRNFVNVEKKLLGFDHPEFCSVLLESWGIPKEVHMPIKYHHMPFNSPYSFRRSSLSLFLANSIHLIISSEFNDTPDFNEAAFEKALERLKINYRALEALYIEVLEEIDRMEI